MHISLARLASFCHLGFISDPLIVSKFHNETHDPKGQENKIYTIVKGRETFFHQHTVPVTSCNEVKYVLKGIDYCPIEIIKGLIDKGQFQYLTNLKGPQVGNYQNTTQSLSQR